MLEKLKDPSFNADDSLGFCELGSRQLKALFENKDGTELAADAFLDGKDFPPLPLTTQGNISINVAVVDVVKPSWPELVRRLARPVTAVYAEMMQLGKRAIILKREYTTVTITLTLHSARGLLAADVDFFGRGGSSDPYVNFELAGEVVQSTTKQKNLNPEWEEEFTFTKTIKDLESDEDKHMNIEIFDADLLGDDDLIGMTGLRIEEDLLQMAGKGKQTVNKPLHTQGEVSVSYEVSDKQEPLWREIFKALLLPHIRAVRAFILYWRLPYDLTIWSKIRDPWFYVMTYIGASPDVMVRGGFFTIYLACIATELEEFQVMRFILGLKGSQFISGIIKTVILCFKFWNCSVITTELNGCEIGGPGVGHSSVLKYLSIIIWLQARCAPHDARPSPSASSTSPSASSSSASCSASPRALSAPSVRQVLLWFAFLILPFTGKFNPATGKISYKRMRQMWSDAMDWAKEEELKRLQAKLRLQNKAAKKAGLLGGLAAGMGSVVAGVGSVVPGYQSPSYQPFKDEKEKDLEGGSEKVAEDAATGQDADVQEAADKGITVQEAGLARLVKEQNDDSTLAGKINSRIATARLYYDAATYPMRSELKQNRLFSLLTWDSWMFTMCGTLFFVMSVTAMCARARRSHPSHPPSHLRLSSLHLPISPHTYISTQLLRAPPHLPSGGRTRRRPPCPRDAPSKPIRSGTPSSSHAT